jgi:Ser/Thr protein kinase RdoA (MazF antagonist)
MQAWDSVLGAADVEPMPMITNPLWRVNAEDGRCYVLKRLPEYAPGAGWVEGYRVACYLQSRRVRVALPVVTDDGRINAAVDDRLYALVPLLPDDQNGHGLGPDAAEIAYAIGAAIGQVDRMLADCPWQVQSYVDDPAASLEEVLPQLEPDVRRMIEPLADELRTAVAGLPTQRTVGDCNSGNILRQGTEVTGFIDLDHLPIGPRVRDLGSYLVSRLRRYLAGPDGESAASAMVEVLGDHVAGYHGEYPLSRRELAAVVPMMIVIEIGGAHWSLHGWVVDQEGYRRSVAAIRWMIEHRLQLSTAAIAKID